MPTTLNNPATRDESGWGFVIGIILVVVLGLLFFLYGLPAIRDSSGGTGGGTEPTPATQDGTPNPSPPYSGSGVHEGIDTIVQ